jgi:hypothetical protein
MNKELRSIIRDLEANGFEVGPEQGRHRPVFKGGVKVTTLSTTPSDWRSRRNELAPAYRMGLPKPRDRGAQKGKSRNTPPTG